MEPIAYGRLGLAPAAFEAMTLREFRAAQLGGEWRDDRAFEEQAEMTQLLLTALGATISIDEVLGETRVGRRTERAAALDAYVEEEE